ncbi:MAG: phosphocholine cytidylyltransferase family protein [Desulfobacterales bacterium]|nr:phosphocholine cytidylyltransferase family protein [Desulfobacterales bacterium]
MSFSDQRITTALLLAAGMGTRLNPLTRDFPKCLTRVNGVPILERMADSLVLNGFKKLIVVTGHLDQCIKSFLESYAGDLEISYIYADQYRTTNNICSLWMAREAVTAPFLLIESDLIFDPGCLAALQEPDRIAIAGMKPWMNGTVVTLDHKNRVNRFLDIHEAGPDTPFYKTVNIYSLSEHSWQVVRQELDIAVRSGNTQDYYESVFKTLVARKKLEFTPVFFDNFTWYEIDTIQDLAEAEKLFTGAPETGMATPWEFEPDTEECHCTQPSLSED